MTANEWLGVMKQAQDFPKGMEKLIVKYGEMLIAEHESKVKKLSKADVIKAVCDNCKGDLKNKNGYIFCTDEKCGTVYEQTVL